MTPTLPSTSCFRTLDPRGGGERGTIQRMDAYEREENDIQERYARGEMTNAEMWAEMRELQRDRRAAAHEAAQDAYDREMERW